MTIQEYKSFVEKLEQKGYRQYPPHNTADKAFYKSFGKGNNKYDEDRSNYQICYSLWDFSPYKDRDFNPYSFSVTILVSRVIDERLDLEVGRYGIDITNIDEVETFAENFFKWVDSNVKIK